MTGESFAEMVNARRTRAGKWQARCPAHEDKHPSLSIMQGRDGVLLRCRSHGCTAEQIVIALGLSMRDLFHDATLTPEQRQQAAQAKVIRDAEQRRQRVIDRAARDRIYRLEELMHALGARLIRRPDDDKMAELFHQVCDKLHELESSEPHHEDGPLRLSEPSGTPGWIHDALVEIGQNFDTKETARSEQAA